jgi:hypothetical protein
VVANVVLTIAILLILTVAADWLNGVICAGQAGHERKL